MEMTFATKYRTRIGFLECANDMVNRTASKGDSRSVICWKFLDWVKQDKPVMGRLRSRMEVSFYYSGRAESNQNSSGVGLLFTKRTCINFLEWTLFFDRIITIHFKTNLRPITIVQRYAPLRSQGMEEKNEFYRKLTSTVAGIRKVAHYNSDG